MKFLNKLALIVFSWIILVASVLTCVVIFGWISIPQVERFIAFALMGGTLSKVILGFRQLPPAFIR